MIKYSFIIYLFLFNSLYAESLYLESGTKRNSLIELYTSEGCSSCPPAEAYLNTLKNNAELWKKWVPVAFHVNYWDYIGWKDRYATEKFGQRQSRYASLTGASTVYTPAFFVNGTSWRRGLFSTSLPSEESTSGNLIVSIKDKSFEAMYKVKTKSPLKLSVAILGMDLKTYIEKGENAGRQAKHEFVVVGFNELVSDNLMWKIALPKLHYNKAKKYAVAVWVSSINDPTPLQVVGSHLPGFTP